MAGRPVYVVGIIQSFSELPNTPASRVGQNVYDINGPSAIRTSPRQARAAKRRGSSGQRTPVKGLAKPGGP